MVTVNSLMFQRADTAANATTNNPTFSESELFHETDTGMFLIGNGSTAYTGFTSSQKFQTPQKMLSAAIQTSAPSNKHVLAYNSSNTRYENRLLVIADLSDSANVFDLSGQTGGQTAYGGDGAGDDLTLRSTSHATKGKVYFGSVGVYDETNANFGFGETSPLADTKVHIKTGDCGITSLDASANELFVEGVADAGITIGSGTTSTGNIYFGDSGSNNIGRLVYDHSDNSMSLYANATEGLRVISDGGVKAANLKSGATAAAAGAATNELWVTASHATLPNGVVMIG